MPLYVKPSTINTRRHSIPSPLPYSPSSTDHATSSRPLPRPLPDKIVTEHDLIKNEELITSSSSNSRSTLPPASSIAPHFSRKNKRLLLLYRKRYDSAATSVSLEDDDAFAATYICPVCSKPNCQLRSHRQYAYRRKDPLPSKPKNEDSDPVLSLTAAMGNSLVESFISLPIANADSDMQRAFRDFFVAQATSMTNPVRVRSFDIEYCPMIFRESLTDPALCFTCIAMSATFSAIHGQGLRSPDAKLLSIYGRTFRMLREELIGSGPNKHHDNTLMAAINLLMCHGIGFGDEQAMIAHPAGLKNLVNGCGGIQNLKGQLSSLSLWADLYVTFYTGRRPMFLDQVGILPIIELSNPPNVQYGWAFLELEQTGVISPMLLEVCDTTCRLTELLEDRVRGRGTPARWEYFLYRRNTMAMRNGLVHSELFKTGTKAECISLINNILLFLYLRLMPWKMPLFNLANQLRIALRKTNLENFWERDINALVWILFIVQAVDRWEGKDWGLKLLLETLSHCYSCKNISWPPNWREMQRLNLMEYAWSEIYLTQAFKTTCRDLGTLYRDSMHKPG